jgi:hypothetical protein
MRVGATPIRAGVGAWGVVRRTVPSRIKDFDSFAPVSVSTIG